jgi:hypothetical protein
MLGYILGDFFANSSSHLVTLSGFNKCVSAWMGLFSNNAGMADSFLGVDVLMECTDIRWLPRPDGAIDGFLGARLCRLLSDADSWGRFYKTVSSEIYGQNLICQHLSL